jgi:hypothetical protein
VLNSELSREQLASIVREARQRGLGHRSKWALQGVKTTAYMLKDRCRWPTKAWVDPNVDFYVKIDCCAAVEVVNNLQADITMFNR